MKYILNLLGSNKGGAEVLEKYDNQEIGIKSKFVSSDAPPLATLFLQEKEVDIQLIDVRFEDKNMLITAFAVSGDKGGRVVFSLTPICYENRS